MRYDCSCNCRHVYEYIAISCSMPYVRERLEMLQIKSAFEYIMFSTRSVSKLQIAAAIVVVILYCCLSRQNMNVI